MDLRIRGIRPWSVLLRRCDSKRQSVRTQAHRSVTFLLFVSQTFTCFVLLDLTSAVQNRGLATPLNGNKMLTLTISASLLVQFLLVYFPPLQGVFQTQSLAFNDLALLLFIAALGFAAHEARRRYERRLNLAGDQWVDEIA
jgi:P-type Ca2+ transporter type 2C